MDDYDENEASKYLIYLDANQLYSYAMSQPLPTGEFKWNDEHFDTQRIMEMDENSGTGYIFEVDLEYPESLHEKHSDYPFLPENRKVESTDMRKLLLTLYNKEKYVIHYTFLRLALKHGLILKKVHRVLQFKESKWLKPFIDLNIELRKRATSDFEKNFFKLMCNAIFGKSMENLRQRVDIKLKNTWDGRYGVGKLVSLPNFKKQTIFNENFAAIEMNPTSIFFNKPIYLGLCVLDISKVLMYSFHYDQIKKDFDRDVTLLYTDTDSFIYEIACDDFYQYMNNNNSMFDTSAYPPSNKFNIKPANKGVVGLFKDELHGEIMTGFVGLRSKMYAVRTKNGDAMKKAKGVKKNVLKNTITFDHFVHCLYDKRLVHRTQNMIRSKLHKVYSIEQSKICLSPFDDKRQILDDFIHTRPYGYLGNNL